LQKSKLKLKRDWIQKIEQRVTFSSTQHNPFALTRSSSIGTKVLSITIDTDNEYDMSNGGMRNWDFEKIKLRAIFRKRSLGNGKFWKDELRPRFFGKWKKEGN